TANVYSDRLSVLLGNGNGTFQAPLNYVIHDYGAATATADFNGDYWPDLVVARADDPLGEVVVLLNAGDWWGGSPGGSSLPPPPGGDDVAQAGLALANSPVTARTRWERWLWEDRLAGLTLSPLIGPRPEDPVFLAKAETATVLDTRPAAEPWAAPEA